MSREPAGAATGHYCECGAPASQWVYLDGPDRYSAVCRPCREWLDIRIARAAKAAEAFRRSLQHIPRCTVCNQPVIAGQGRSHFECRPRCPECGMPAGICTPGCPNASRGWSLAAIPAK